MTDFAEPWADREPEHPMRGFAWAAIIGAILWGVPIWILIAG